MDLLIQTDNIESMLADKNRTYHIAQEHMALLPNYYRWMYAPLQPFLHGSVIELGCGAGHGIGTYLDKVDQVVAVDYNQGVLDQLKKAAPDPKIRTIQADLLNGWSELEGVRGDAVVMMDALEHFRDDAAIMRKCHALLNEDGTLCIKVPAHRELYGNIDRASGHYRRYDREDMESLAVQTGFRVVSIRPVNRLGRFMYGLKKQSKTNFSGTFPPWQLKAINLAMPVLKATDSCFGILGLSWIVILKKQK